MGQIIIGNMELVEYNGVYSLIAVRGYQGKHYQQWCRIELGKEKKLSDKSQPIKVILGNKDEAIVALTQLKAILQGGKTTPQQEDVPF